MTPGPIDVIACPACGLPQTRGDRWSGELDGRWSDGRGLSSLGRYTAIVIRCARCDRFFWQEEASFLRQIEAEVGCVILVDAGAQRLRVMAIVRSYLGTDPATTRRLVDDLPLTIEDSRYDVRVTELHADLLRVGATAQLIHPAPRQPLDAHEYREALREGTARTPEEEVVLRVYAWWSDNDPYRPEGAAWAPFARRSPTERENLERLHALLAGPLRPAEIAPHLRYEGEPWPVALISAEVARQLGLFDEALAILSRGTGAQTTDQLRAAELIAAGARRGDDALAVLWRL